MSKVIYYLSKAIALFLLLVFCRFRVRGKEHFPRSGPCLIVANHSSYLDPVVVGCACPRRVYFVAKEELFRNPVAAFFLKQLGAFPLRRGEKDAAAIKRVLSLLREGKVVCLFPEGTRNQGEILDFKPGVVKLLVKAGVPVVVAGIRGTFESFPRGRSFPKPFPITVNFSLPLFLDSEGPEAVEEKVKSKMKELIQVVS